MGYGGLLRERSLVCVRIESRSLMLTFCNSVHLGRRDHPKSVISRMCTPQLAIFLGTDPSPALVSRNRIVLQKTHKRSILHRGRGHFSPPPPTSLLPIITHAGKPPMEGKRGMRRRRRAFKNFFKKFREMQERGRENGMKKRVEGGFFPHHFRCKVAPSAEKGYSAGFSPREYVWVRENDVGVVI